MEKLDLKEIVGYLPYGLKFQYEGITNLKEISSYNKTEPKSRDYLGDVYMHWLNNKPKDVIGKRVSEIKEIKFYKNHIRIYVGRKHGYLKLVFLEEIKPILRPLSDLTKEIEHNGENIVPLQQLKKIFYNVEFNDFISFDPFSINISMNSNSGVYWGLTFQEINGIIQKLYEWHFDLHSLILRNLAIDINTIQPCQK